MRNNEGHHHREKDPQREIVNARSAYQLFLTAASDPDLEVASAASSFLISIAETSMHLALQLYEEGMATLDVSRQAASCGAFPAIIDQFPEAEAFALTRGLFNRNNPKEFRVAGVKATKNLMYVDPDEITSMYLGELTNPQSLEVLMEFAENLGDLIPLNPSSGAIILNFLAGHPSAKVRGKAIQAIPTLAPYDLNLAFTVCKSGLEKTEDTKLVIKQASRVLGKLAAFDFKRAVDIADEIVRNNNFYPLHFVLEEALPELATVNQDAAYDYALLVSTENAYPFKNSVAKSLYRFRPEQIDTLYRHLTKPSSRAYEIYFLQNLPALFHVYPAFASQILMKGLQSKIHSIRCEAANHLYILFDNNPVCAEKYLEKIFKSGDHDEISAATSTLPRYLRYNQEKAMQYYQYCANHSYYLVRKKLSNHLGPLAQIKPDLAEELLTQLIRDQDFEVRKTVGFHLSPLSPQLGQVTFDLAFQRIAFNEESAVGQTVVQNMYGFAITSVPETIAICEPGLRNTNPQVRMLVAQNLGIIAKQIDFLRIKYSDIV